MNGFQGLWLLVSGGVGLFLLSLENVDESTSTPEIVSLVQDNTTSEFPNKKANEPSQNKP